MEIIDCHLHLLLTDQGLNYPWATTRGLTQKYQLSNYTNEAKNCSITKMLHMEADVNETQINEEANIVKSLADVQSNNLAGQIIACRPEQPYESFYNSLSLIKNNNKTVKGMRRILHEAPDTLSHSNVFLGNIQLLSDFNYSFDLVVLARQLKTVAIPLIYQCPNVEFILDHCGNPLINSNNPNSTRDWQDSIAIIAQFPNVSCKISGLVSNAPLNWRDQDLQPYFDHCVECFSIDRLVWGSDWPVCTLNGSLTRWVETSRNLAAKFSQAEQKKLFYENALRIYKIA